MPRVSGIVSTISNNSVTTKYGPKKTYTFVVDGAEFRTNFKDSGVKPGDGVTFDYTAGKYGNDVDVASLVITGGGNPVPAAPARPSVVSSGGGGRGVFPVPALAGERAINRQNALTNAVKFVELENRVSNSGVTADHVIEVARKFEAYTCGDDDMAAAAAQVSSEKAAA